MCARGVAQPERRPHIALERPPYDSVEVSRQTPRSTHFEGMSSLRRSTATAGGRTTGQRVRHARVEGRTQPSTHAECHECAWAIHESRRARAHARGMDVRSGTRQRAGAGAL